MALSQLLCGPNWLESVRPMTSIYRHDSGRPHGRSGGYDWGTFVLAGVELPGVEPVQITWLGIRWGGAHEVHLTREDGELFTAYADEGPDIGEEGFPEVVLLTIDASWERPFWRKHERRH